MRFEVNPPFLPFLFRSSQHPSLFRRDTFAATLCTEYSHLSIQLDCHFLVVGPGLARVLTPQSGPLTRRTSAFLLKYTLHAPPRILRRLCTYLGVGRDRGKERLPSF